MNIYRKSFLGLIATSILLGACGPAPTEPSASPSSFAEPYAASEHMWDPGDASYWPEPSAEPSAEPGAAPMEQPSTQPTQDLSNESYAQVQENAFISASEQALSTFSIDVDTASYSNIRRMLNYKQLPPAGAVRIEELINYFNYDYPGPQDEHPFRFHTELAQAPWSPEHQLLKIGLQAQKVDKSETPRSNLVFLLDVSGSMDSPEKLPLLKRSLKLLLEQLDENDRISIVVYAGAAGQVLAPTPANQRESIIAALDRLEAGGSTAGGAGIELAYKLAQQSFIPGGNNRVILATDGDFNVGASSDTAMETLITQKREAGVFLSVLGFGMGNYQDSKMEILANKGNGNYAYIDTLEEAKKVLVQDMTGTLLTVAKDVKLQLSFDPEKVKSYRLIGYENRVLANQDFADDKKDAGELGAGHKVTALYEIIPQDNIQTGDLGQLKLRYKRPDADTSQLLEAPIPAQSQSFENASTDFKFAASVASFGMLLRSSKYAGSSNFAKVIEWGQAGRGTDVYGYRGGYLELVQQAAQLQR